MLECGVVSGNDSNGALKYVLSSLVMLFDCFNMFVSGDNGGDGSVFRNWSKNMLRTYSAADSSERENQFGTSWNA